MIIFLCSHFHRYTLGGVLASPRARADIRVRPYRWLFARDRIPGATYVFTDHERLPSYELSAAGRAFHSMRAAGLRVLNDPARVLVRADLLHELRGNGTNPFTAYRAALGPRPQSFPVFLRDETDHSLFSDALIANQLELDERLEQLKQNGVPLRHLLVVEFSAAPIRPGVYQKLSVFRVGDTYLPYPPVMEETWAVKYGKLGLATDADLDAAIEEIDTSPHAHLLQPAFEAAHIDYGRADFGLVGDRLSVFEINTNPSVSPLKPHRYPAYGDACTRAVDAIAAAISALDSSGPSVRIDWPTKWYGRLRFFAGLTLKQP